MIASEALNIVAALHAQLAGVLVELDRAGRALAAAHVVAAIDVLEAELAGRALPRFAHETDDGVGAMAEAMRHAFGTSAIEVARRQLADADGLARIAWAAIVQQLADA